MTHKPYNPPRVQHGYRIPDDRPRVTDRNPHGQPTGDFTGRYGIGPAGASFTAGDPEWYRLGPVSVVDDPHPPPRHCACPKCAPSFDSDALEKAMRLAKSARVATF